jgi:aspartyl-tRNA(Asn)/glutamyl-tRNA(Gln) amidotransferase subunit C
MALTTEEVRRIASLARLRFTPEEEAAMAGQLGKIVEYIDQLQRFEAGPPAAAAAGAAVTAPAPRAAPEADDVARPCLPRESFLANAPAALDGFLLVPEVRRAAKADLPQVPGAGPGVGNG